MAKKLYVGNLPWSMSTEDLSALFSKYGEVSSAEVKIFPDTKRSRGFGFVEFVEDSAADAAIAGLDGNEEASGRKLIVNEARPREERPAGGAGGFRRGFGGPRGGDDFNMAA